MSEPTNGMMPPDETGKFDEHVAVTIRTAVDEWRVHNDPADPHDVSMPEYIRRALANAGLLARPAEAQEPFPVGLSDLRNLIERAILDRAPVWGQKFEAGPGAVCSVADAATVATRVVATEVSQLRADKEIRQTALNGVLGRPAPADYYEAVEDVAQLRKSSNGLLEQIEGMATLAWLHAEAVWQREQVLRNRRHWHETFGHAPAYLCEVCHGEPVWRLERHGDAVVTWSCDVDLGTLVRAGQRPGRSTEISVIMRRAAAELNQEADGG